LFAPRDQLAKLAAKFKLQRILSSARSGSDRLIHVSLAGHTDEPARCYLGASKRLLAQRIGGRVLIRVADLRKYTKLRSSPGNRKLTYTFRIIDAVMICVHNSGRSDGWFDMESLPVPVKNAMGKLGSDLRDARLRRRIPVALMASRVFISRTTLVKLEKGDPGVAMGTYAAALWALGMIDRLRELASAGSDEVGLALEGERLPKRIQIRPMRMTAAPARRE
jgi:DNA-binding XRE family transcriptional regulator